jgi:hypothetical protein
MAAGDTMQGRRVDFWPGWPGGVEGPAEAGDYCCVPPGVDHRGNVWYAVDPSGGAGAIVTHTVVVNDDRSITCSPSLVMPSGWHGFLEHGVWREV